MATTFSYHVPGPIVPQANVGSASAYVPLGVCYDGADIRLLPKVHDIKHDGGGGPDGDETENIFLNMTAEITFKLVPFAGDYINTLRAKSHAGSTGGTMVIPGTLYGQNAMLPALYLPVGAGEVDGPWWFRTCRVVNPGSNKVNVKDTNLDFVLRAINWFNIAAATSIVANVLYSRSAPP